MSPYAQHILLTAACVLLAAPASTLAQCAEVEIPMWGGPQVNCDYGAALAVNGDLALVGAPSWAPAGGVPEGLVTVAEWNGSSWDVSQLPSLAVPWCEYGSSLAINEAGDMLAVGGPGFSTWDVRQGMVGLYDWDGGATGFMYGIGAGPKVELGTSVDASGDVVVAGAPAPDFSTGSAIVYRRVAPGSWVSEQTLLAEIGGSGDRFGSAVAVSGDRIAVGAPRRHNGTIAFAGAVDVFEHDGLAWVKVLELKGTEATQQLGSSLDLSGDLLVVGSPNMDGGSGKAQLGRLVGGGFDEQLSVTGPAGFAQLGFDVALSDSRCAIGVPNHTQAPLGVIGGVELAHHVPGYFTPWNRAPLTLISGVPENEAYFGRALALSGQRLLVASPGAGGSANTVGRVVSVELGDSVGYADLGDGLAGFGGQTPLLAGYSPPCQQPEIFWIMTGARPLATAHLVLGLANLGAAFKGGVMVPTPDIVISPLPIDASGALPLFLTVPAGLPAGSLYTQLWIQDVDGPVGFSASNGLRSDLPAF